MRERQVEEHHVAGLCQAMLHLVCLRDHRVVVAVADHAGLRRPGCARGVDEREEIVLIDRVRALVERAGILRRKGATPFAQVSEVGKREDVLEVRAEFRALFVVLDERADTVRVLDHVLHVVRRAVRVDRRADGAYECQREIEQRPFEIRAREDCEGIAAPDPECQQAVRDLVDGLGGIGPGHFLPLT